jgi:type II secretory pathway component PulJ
MSGGRLGGQDGTVLVEVLAALSLVAVMSGLILGYFGQLGALARMQQAVALEAELAAAAGHVQRTIEAARATPLATAERTTPAVFEGAADRMRFVAVTRRGQHALGLGEVRFAAGPAGSGMAVVQSVQSRRGEGAAAVNDALVIDGLAWVLFEYADAGGDFQPGWSAASLPRAVRISLGRRLDGRVVSVQAIARLP